MTIDRIFEGWWNVIRSTGWRHLLMALAIATFFMLFGPHGGAFFTTIHEGVDPLTDPDKHYLSEYIEHALLIGVPLVVAVRFADVAIAQGATRWLAYGAALLTVGVLNHLCRATAFYETNGSAPPAQTAWYYLVIILQGGIGLTIYARWRAAQASMRMVQASETDRARTVQRLQSARLLALQARVDPQLLFDSLERIGVLQRRDPAAADALLTDLIALLRAMLPAEAAITSSVEREFTVVDAWLSVSRAVSHGLPTVDLRMASASRMARLAPMLALPLTRAVLEATHGLCNGWRLEADVAGSRLLVALCATDAPPDIMRAVIDGEKMAALRERLASLHGDAAHLFVSIPTSTVTLDFPFEPEDSDESPHAQ